MNKLLRILVLPALLSTGAVVALPGCGGGSGGLLGQINQNVSRFAGTYNGTFTGTTTAASGKAGQAVSGTLIAIIQPDGKVGASITQPGVGIFAASGTVDSSGNITVTATPSQGQTSTVAGKITFQNGNYSFTGSFTTLVQGTAVVTGSAQGSRTSTSTLD